MGPQDQPTDRDGASTVSTGLSVHEVTEVTEGGPPGTDGELVDLEVLAAGLVIAPAGEGPRAVPTLVAWGRLRGFSAEHGVTLADGSSVQLLEVVVDDGVLAGGTGVRRFAVPAPDLVGFFGEISAFSEEWRASTAPGRGDPLVRRLPDMAAAAAVALWAAVAHAWRSVAGSVGGVRARSAGRSAPRHGLGTRRRWVPITAGVLLLAVLAGGETTASVTSSATGLPHHGRSPVNRGIKYLVPVASAAVNLPAATAAPGPGPAVAGRAAPLQSHEIFGYAPYWTLPESAGSTCRTSPHWPTSASTSTATAPSTRAVRVGTATRARTWSTW